MIFGVFVAYMHRWGVITVLENARYDQHIYMWMIGSDVARVFHSIPIHSLLQILDATAYCSHARQHF